MTTRRKFLAMTATAACTPLAVANPIDPFRRTGRTAFKLSLAAYSMRQYLDPKSTDPRKMNLPQFMDYCASLGLHGAEPTSYYFSNDISLEQLVRLKRRAHMRGLSLSAGAIRNDFCLPPGDKLEADVKHCELWIERYAALGVPAIRVFAGSVPKGEAEEAVVPRCVATLERACQTAGKAGVMLALENHGGITKNADRMLEIVKAVQSHWFGVNLDSGNFRDSPDPYADLAKIAPYAVNAQIKIEVTRKVDGKSITEETDYRKVIRILKDAGYTGWIALEYEGKEDPYAGIPKALDKLKTALAAEGF